MYFKQLVKEDLGCASYIIGCLNEGVCAVVDPRIDMVDEILALTTSKGMRIEAVIETHTHADHVSGHGELVIRTGARIYVHESSGVSYSHQKLKDGDELFFGAVKVRVMHTPGHRPEHIALAVSDTSRGDDPWLVLTGDSLFVGDLARPDLAIPGLEGADALYESIFGRLLKLDEGVEVYPSHVAGSLCGRQMNAKTSSTIGFERKYNWALATRSRAAFVHDMNENLPVRPPNMALIVNRNREDYTQRLANPAPAPEALDALSFQRAMEQGALVLDVRTPEAFCSGHIPGAFHVYLHGSAFSTRVGFVVPAESKLLLVAENTQDIAQVREQLAVVGYESVRGYLLGFMESWRATRLPIQTLERLHITQLYEQRDRFVVLDVRDPGEWNEGHIDSAWHMPFYTIESRLSELDTIHSYAVICASGQRSTLTCALLQRNGFDRVFNVIGGMDAWKAVGLPVVGQAAAL
jgi:hydroxyacylglutathione hydrolase